VPCVNIKRQKTKHILGFKNKFFIDPPRTQKVNRKKYLWTHQKQKSAFFVENGKCMSVAVIKVLYVFRGNLGQIKN
jgi:hypothetical protein